MFPKRQKTVDRWHGPSLVAYRDDRRQKWEEPHDTPIYYPENFQAMKRVGGWGGSRWSPTDSLSCWVDSSRIQSWESWGTIEARVYRAECLAQESFTEREPRMSGHACEETTWGQRKGHLEAFNEKVPGAHKGIVPAATRRFRKKIS